MPVGDQIIASVFSSGGEGSFSAVNPVEEALLEPEFSEASLENVARAVKEAEECFDSYRSLPLNQRASFLDCIADELMTLESELITRAHQETALPQLRLEGELARTVNQLKLISQHVRIGAFVRPRIDRAEPDRVPLAKPDVRTMNIPLGPVAVFGASNFPLAFSVAGGDTASALAAGCPVVVKGHPAHPGTSELAGRAIMSAVEKMGIPSGVFSLLQAADYTIGHALVQHPSIKAVAFTGSLGGGRTLFDLACARSEPIPVFAEMGSVNPVFVFPSAVRSSAEPLAEGLASSLTMGVGQFCTAPGLIFLIKDEASEKFLTHLSRKLDEMPAGTMLHSGIKKNFLSGLHRLSSVDGVEKKTATARALNGYSVSPALFLTGSEVFRTVPGLHEEVFGPAAVVVLCRDKSDLLAVADSLTGQLTASVHGSVEEIDSYSDLLMKLERKAGRLVMNGFPTGVEVCSAMHHGGPYPASTDSRSTSVGTEAVMRFLRPVCYQNFPQEVLPAYLQDNCEEN